MPSGVSHQGLIPACCWSVQADPSISKGRTVASVQAAESALISHPEILARFQAEFWGIALPESLLS